MKHSAYKITISSDGMPDVVVLHNDAPVQVSGGYGGWTVTTRQRRIGLTQWQGKDPIRMDVPVLFDGYADGNGQEIAISTLDRMALPPSSGGEPPVVSISGPAVPRPGPVAWVIESIDWGTNVAYDLDENGHMSRMRQDAVIHLLQYVDEDRVAFKNVAFVSTGASKRGWPKTYTVKAGDTAQRIASKMYGSSAAWKKITQANNIRDGKHLKVGSKLRIPAP